jgi:hypothetical protein
MNILLAVLSAAVIYACFCRLVKGDSSVRRVIRWGFVAQATAALAVGYTALLLPSKHPHAVMAFMGATLWVLAATSAKWKDGAPKEYKHAND